MSKCLFICLFLFLAACGTPQQQVATRGPTATPISAPRCENGGQLVDNKCMLPMGQNLLQRQKAEDFCRASDGSWKSGYVVVFCVAPDGSETHPADNDPASCRGNQYRVRRC